jgi:hypothetical protein
MATDTPTEKPQGFPIITADVQSRGHYSNTMLVAHGPEEFIIDWLLNSPSGTHLVSRIIVSPGHVRRIIDALSDNLRQYESQFGPVQVLKPKDQSSGAYL